MVDLTTPGQSIDPQAPAGSVVSAVGLERDGFRGRNLALSISMLNAATSESWAGIYLTKVEPASTTQTITFDSAPPAAPVVGSSYTLAATASSGLPVTFSLDPASTSGACTLDGSTVHLLKPGTCIIDADQPGNGTFQAAQRVQQVIVVPAIAATVTLTSASSPIAFGGSTQVTAVVTTATGTPSGTVQFAVNGTDLAGPVTVVDGSARALNWSARTVARSRAATRNPHVHTGRPGDVRQRAGHVHPARRQGCDTTCGAVQSTSLTATVTAFGTRERDREGQGDLQRRWQAGRQREPRRPNRNPAVPGAGRKDAAGGGKLRR